MKAKTIAWKGGEHPFLLRIGELRALETSCDLGSRMILVALMASTFRVDHVLETIRLGLIGGGMPDKEAKRILDLALNTCSHTALAIVAANALEYSLSWDADDQPGELQAEAASQTVDLRSQTERPDGPIIMGSVEPSGSQGQRLNA
jgi:hypothetical protein